MENIVNNFLSVITDKSRSIFQRTGFLLIIGFGIFIVNDTFNLSFNYRINQKLEQFQTIDEISKFNGIKPIISEWDLHNIKTQIVSRKPFISKLKDIYSGILENSLTINQRNFLWRLLSGAGIYLLLLLLFPFLEKNRTDLTYMIIGTVFLGISVNVLLFLIPTFDHIFWNHAINILVNLIIMVLLSIYGSKSK